MNDFERDNLRSIMGHIQSRGELERLRKTIEECRHAISTSGGDSNVELEKLPDEIRGIWLRCDGLIKSLHPDGLVVDELERRTTYTVGETEWSHRIATLEHMLAEERENVDTLRARVAELEAEVAILRPWSVMLKRAHGALTDAGCVVPLEFDQSIEHAIKDLARRATRAEQLFVDEYDARRDVERQRDELLRVNNGAAHHGIITECVRELIELLGIQLQNPTANEAVDAAANEIKTLRTTVEELKARITVLEAMR